MTRQTLHDALTQLATHFDLDTTTLHDYAAEDEIGGYHTDPAQATWPMGSLWAVEGQVLYALVRALRPSNVLELGTYAGCSTAHIEAALKKNRKGALVTVDNLHDGKGIDADTGKRVELVNEDAIDYLKKTRSSFDLIFEDLTHETDVTKAAWTYGPKRLEDGGVMVSHDAAHPIVGQTVRDAIRAAGTRAALVLDIAPADCGLAVWRND